MLKSVLRFLYWIKYVTKIIGTYDSLFEVVKKKIHFLRFFTFVFSIVYVHYYWFYVIFYCQKYSFSIIYSWMITLYSYDRHFSFYLSIWYMLSKAWLYVNDCIFSCNLTYLLYSLCGYVIITILFFFSFP